VDSSKQKDKNTEDLLSVLVEKKVISAAQASLVRNDLNATDMTVDEILLARNWVEKETIKSLMPADSSSAEGKDSVPGESYQQNLKKYRQMLARILGESSE